ncbi:TIR domain-containing protein [Prescottella equi]|uniref:TIR domain-containing protein n=1 Tax=Rhodococcus hoagii TaxID=43767 RepID=UPI001F2496B7|nr:TIR domain-containing protein [Prescottella equi]
MAEIDEADIRDLVACSSCGVSSRSIDQGVPVPKSVFYSFHHDRDVHRVQLVRHINALEGQPLLKPQQWEEKKGRGDKAIETWIHSEMSRKKAVIVLIGQETASREWVHYEINKAWRDKKPLLGIRIHGLASMNDPVDKAGADPFEAAGLRRSSVPIFDPTKRDAFSRIDTKATYGELSRQLEGWSSLGAVRIL